MGDAILHQTVFTVPGDGDYRLRVIETDDDDHEIVVERNDPHTFEWKPVWSKAISRKEAQHGE